MFPSFGFQTAVGSVQDYISTNQLATYSVRDVGWITAILVFLTLFLAYRKYWQFVLCLSVLGGISSAVITAVSIAVLSHWFNHRRALASGICMGGSSAGGAIIPLLLRKLFPRLGWTWAIRTLAFVAVGFYTAGISLVKGRLSTGRRSRAIVDFGAFRSPRLCFLAVAVFSFESLSLAAQRCYPLTSLMLVSLSTSNSTPSPYSTA
ncbi:hypothetical protein CNMCM5793_002823 [Aspergillus hiratsukae]|uniref:Major facilitator superfamily (MFS) profile domain-containing protein n=1 Tax=Aspergillus hiratsukae TaxID=1194566 RepID=A0A8H6PD64_9EURO|nr:hypothetical protein CNMCM5793_002823 [Aspergillus hiratsukae]KAF7169570.1 hypothetical protein CNMCM6106_004460 [Aspergillus hiratsukae]